MVMNRRKNSSLLRRNIAKHLSETSLRRYFCFIMSKRGTHLAHIFFVSKFSVSIQCTAIFEMVTTSKCLLTGALSVDCHPNNIL